MFQASVAFAIEQNQFSTFPTILVPGNNGLLV